MTAEEVKDALRRRHPAWGQDMVGEWVCIEEWLNIDLLACSAWGKGKRIGYEVKVSRSDLRSELLRPDKRSRGVQVCNEFYFAVPAGMLTEEELAFDEPEWEPEDFERSTCTNPDCRLSARPHQRHRRGPLTVRGPRFKDSDREGASITVGYGGVPINACCYVCRGYGHTERSRVESEAPTLWVPKDVGLVEITPRGCRVTRKAPCRWKDVKPLARTEKNLHQLLRFVSARPDPRHVSEGRVA